MAEQIRFQPKVDPSVSARDELEALLETLHESGTLRTLNGFFGRLPDISRVAMGELASEPGRQSIANLSILFLALARIEPRHLSALVEGTQRGLSAARDALENENPSLLSVARVMRDPDTRRGLYAMGKLLREIGRQVPHELEETS